MEIRELTEEDIPSLLDLYVQLAEVNKNVTLEKAPGGKAKLTILDNGEGADEVKIKSLNAEIKSDYLPEHGLGIRVVKQVAKKYKYSVKFSSVPGEYFKSELILK